MNRRNFIKTGALTLGVSAFPIWNFFQKKTELEDLYAYLESHTILHPIKGEIPFKLHPYQKAILKHIHENNRVVIVKARQIGMTTLLAGYMKWKESYFIYQGINSDFHFMKLYTERFRYNENPKESRFLILDDHQCDFSNYLLLSQPPSTTANVIIAGTPDSSGHLKWVVDNKDKFNLKVFTYSAYDCPQKWTKKDIQCQKELSRRYDKNSFKREIEAKFV